MSRSTAASLSVVSPWLWSLAPLCAFVLRGASLRAEAPVQPKTLQHARITEARQAARDRVSVPAPPNWVRVTDHAAWKPRDSCGEAVFRDRMWIMGGWFDSYSEPPRDVWSSPE